MTTIEQRKGVQTLLQGWGYYTGKIDGDFGPLSDAAWRALKTATDKAVVASAPSTAGAPPFIAELIRIAHAEVGVKEVGTNSGKRVNEYQSADWLPGGGYAWCASFICWLIWQTIKEGYSVRFDRPQTAGAWDFENWALDQRVDGVQLIKPADGAKVRRGDIVVFKISHIGLAVEDEADGHLVTIEGNTNGDGSREGDGVYKKRRPKSAIRSIIRLV